MIKKALKGIGYVWKGEYQPILSHLNSKSLKYNRTFHSKFIHKQGCDVINEDWDFLIILDACRYDVFQRVNWLTGKLEYRYSAGGNSFEFMKENFQDRELHDTVYISANPHSAKLDKNTFHAHELLDSRNDGIPISPSKVTEAAVKASDKYTNKRLIIHYMEPHYPFTDDYGRSLVDEYAESSYDENLPLSWPISKLPNGDSNTPPTKKVRMAYRENLRYGLNAVENLIAELNGKIVVTSDHGELLGERVYPIPVSMWGHLSDIHHEKLRKVPWLVIESEERRQINSEVPRDTDIYDDENIKWRLEALGYK